MTGWDELLAAIQGRLDTVAATHDPASVLEPAALDEARQLAGMLQEGKRDLKALHLLGWLFWYRYQASQEGRDQPDFRAATTAFVPCFIAGVSGLPPALQPVLAGQAVPTATAMLDDALQSPDQELSATVDLWQRILDATPPDHPGRAERLSNLGGALRTRFERTGVPADLDRATEAAQTAVEAVPPGHPNRARYLFNLGSALGARFWRAGALADLDAAIEALRAAVDAAPPGDPDREASLSNLSTALAARFRRTEALADLDAAIDALRALVDATPAGHPDLAARLASLGGALQTRFGRIGVLADLDEAVEVGRKAVDATPAGHPDLAERLSDLGIALQTRFERTRALADVDAAIEALQAAVEATPPDRPELAGRLSNLGLALRNRFERTSALTDVDAAVEAGRAAADATPPGHPDRPAILSNLGAALGARFGRNGVMADLDAAVEALRDAVDAIPADSAERAGYLSNLGVALHYRFEQTGALADLNGAVAALRDAVETTPPGHPDLAGRLSNLGGALQARFQRTAEGADLTDVNEAIRVGQAAVDATPTGRPERARYLSNLGPALRYRFEQTGALADLDAAVEAGQMAVASTATGDPERPLYVTNLSNALRARFDHTGNRGDLDAAVEALQAAIELTPAEHLQLGRMLSNLGGLLQARFEHTGALADRDAAVSAFVAAAAPGPTGPSVRIQAARAAASLVARSDPGQAAGLLEAAVRLLPQVAPRQLERSDQQYAIGGLAGLAGDAAALALADTGGGASAGERAARALGLLEAGRAVLLSQALDTRSDLTDLRHQHPDLAARFTELRAHLDQPSVDFASVGELDGGVSSAAAYASRAAEDRRGLAGEFTAVLEQIRGLEGFASFGLPPTTGELLAEAAPGPVVTFNVSTYGSGALLLTKDGVTCLQLPHLAHDTLIDRINAFREALSTTADPSAGLPKRIAAQQKLLEILGWLWDAVAGPVLDALGYRTGPEPGGEWPRVWWAPGGLLGLLPVHAAGHHTGPPGNTAQRSVMDRVVSSWTPTIRALRYARERTPVAAAERALIVAMPVTPGVPGGGELPNVPMEVARVRVLLPHLVLLAEPGATDDVPYDAAGVPTRANVFENLPGCPVAHFACHGASDPTDPSRSLLILHDHDSAPLTVASLAPVNLGQAQLAYLSACDTALTPGTTLTDEAIHLTTAFQLAGFPHVIGTLWPIDDATAVDIAVAFYTTLRASPNTVETSQAASALHHALRAARDALPRTPYLWAAYLHAGT